MSEAEVFIKNIYKSIEFTCKHCNKYFGNTDNISIDEFLEHEKNCDKQKG